MWWGWAGWAAGSCHSPTMAEPHFLKRFQIGLILLLSGEEGKPVCVGNALWGWPNWLSPEAMDWRERKGETLGTPHQATH